MKIPFIPIVVAAILLTLVVYFFNSTSSGELVLDVPKVSRLADVDGVETEIAVTPDGNRYAVVSSGDIWLIDGNGGGAQKIIETPEPESFPAWTSDGQRLTFSRGPDTFVVAANTPRTADVFKENATNLSFSSTGRMAFVRDRGLWITDISGANERVLVEPTMNPEATIRSPRFSPDSLQLAFIKTVPELHGQIWLANVTTGAAQAIVADRQAENPTDVGWLSDGTTLVYITNRAGSYAIWYFDMVENIISPLTPALFGIPLADVGMAVWKDRVVLPRHFLDSDITWADGSPIVQSDDIELEPAVSPNGQTIAYTIHKENKFEIWTAGIRGENPIFRTLGREPRFSPTGFQIVYTHTDLNGNPDVWTMDLRDNSSEAVTDAEEIDINADWSPDGRNIVFASSRGGNVSIWEIPTSGGKRLRLNDGGYFPRYSPDGKMILFWNKGALWTMDPMGRNIRMVHADVNGPVPGAWTQDGPRFFGDMDISGGKPIWPAFDVARDGRIAIAPIEIRATELWSVDVTYKQVN